MNVLFSIIIPTYNRANTLPRAIKSVLAQTYGNFELIIVDDGSTDDTEAVVKNIEDDRIRYFKKENEERNIARNFGINHAQGDYVCFLDSDDYYYPNHLAAAQKLIVTRKVEIIHLGYEVIDEHEKIIATHNNIPTNINSYLIRDNVFSCNAVVIRQSLLKEVRFINSKVAITSEDHCLWLRLAARAFIHVDNTVTSVVCEHGERSLRNINPEFYRVGTLEIIDELLRDKVFLRRYQKEFNRFIAKKYSFIALIYIINYQSYEAQEYLLKAFRQAPMVIFTNRFLAVTKKVLVRAISK
ncbi:glycosyltransferase family 2 protein [Tunicatimonas pelagia]|uniref:glycosyltransferase family 2 protein n=1 Tax=Tunicatimonas pelagia TaxID=931531 RepID=UPI0026662287|nr:glycosyltransferase [Tunicatimonas pelagia]WKN44445.1 glycosyltransferase [Tunicatimonas pelagia]